MQNGYSITRSIDFLFFFDIKENKKIRPQEISVMPAWDAKSLNQFMA